MGSPIDHGAFLTLTARFGAMAAAERVFTVLGDLNKSPQEVNNNSGLMTSRKCPRGVKIAKKINVAD
jgi:hypothetical protein